MKHKVAELEGALLDAAVAKANGMPWAVTKAFQGEVNKVESPPFCVAGWRNTDHLWGAMSPYSPATDWRIGGEIIDRDGLWLSCSDKEDGREWFASFSPHTECYGEDDNPEIKRIFKHRQPLTAAMRAFVASRFGEEVDL